MKLKRIITIMVALSAAFMLLVPNARAQGDEVRSFYMVHKGSGKVVSEYRSDEKFAVAGLSFMPAMLIVSEAVENNSFSLTNLVTVSSSAAKLKGSTAFVEKGEVISAEGLYKSAAIICAGDAIYALAESACGNAEKAVNAINKRLGELGIDCKYSDIEGNGVELSACDLGKIACALSDCKCYLKYCGIYMDSIEHSNKKCTELVNQNRLIRNLQGCKGLCTSSEHSAGYCGAFYIERNGCEYISVVIGAKTSQMRFDLAQTEAESAYSTYKEEKLADAGDTIIYNYPIKGAKRSTCDIVALKKVSVLCELSSEKMKCTYDIAESLTAPVKQGDCVGNANYTDADGNVVAVLELTVAEDIKKAVFFDFFKIVAQVWLKIQI